eukprot:scaffold205535_cov35-Tisochrysis_lutea.AAC.2
MQRDGAVRAWACRDAARKIALVAVATFGSILGGTMSGVRAPRAHERRAIDEGLRREEQGEELGISAYASRVCGWGAHQCAFSGALVVDPLAVHSSPVPLVRGPFALVLGAVGGNVRTSPMHLTLHEVARVARARRPAAQPRARDLSCAELAVVLRAICER